MMHKPYLVFSSILMVTSIACPSLATAQSPAVLHDLSGGAVGDRFGASLSSAGDVDGDGYTDLLVGAPGVDGAVSDSGRVVLLSGRLGSPLLTIEGDAAGGEVGAQEFGFSVDAAGDFDGDGFVDIVVGLPGQDLGALIDVGGARVFSGATGTTLYSATGSAARHLLGYAVSGAGDTNADGRDDVVIGRPHLLLLTPEMWIPGGPGAALIVSGADATTLHELSPPGVYTGYGAAVDQAGDLDGDGFADVVIGVRALSISSGSMEVRSGADGTKLLEVLPSPGLTGQADSWSVAGGVDVNQDGVPDLLVSTPVHFNHLSVLSWVDLISGADGTLLRRFYGIYDDGDRFGAAVAFGPDVEGDGVPDIVIGAPQAKVYYVDPVSDPGKPGYAQVLSGADGALIHHIDAPSGESEFGWSVAVLDNVNSAGLADFAVGAPSVEADTAGRVIVATSSCGEVSSHGLGCPGAGGHVPHLSVGGCATKLATMSLGLEGGLGGSQAFLFHGVDNASIRMGFGCKLLVAPLLPLILGPFPLSAGGPGDGSFSLNVEITPDIPTHTLSLQMFVVDPTTPGGFCASNAVRRTIL